ncbi:MAG: type II secretion system GspH family protein [Phycisphaerae bacterium]|nr:type II secretion system GspH family protein [Phycisphaerae bacterium]
MRKSGFTLVEIVAVIGIVSVILTILVPVLGGARRRARSVLCRSNIRQIGIAFDLYSANNDCLPYAYVMYDSVLESVYIANDASVDWPGVRWYHYLDVMPDRFVPQNSVLQCPSKNYTELQFKYNIQWGNYGMNWSVGKSPRLTLPTACREFEGSPTKLTSLDRPSDTLLLADSGYAWIAWFHTLASTHPSVIMTNHELLNQIYLPGASVNRQKTLWPAQEEDALYGRHPNRTVNCLFADGHIENKKADDLVVQPLDHGQFTNRSPLWQP